MNCGTMELHCSSFPPACTPLSTALSYSSLTLSLISDALEQQADSPNGVINGSSQRLLGMQQSQSTDIDSDSDSLSTWAISMPVLMVNPAPAPASCSCPAAASNASCWLTHWVRKLPRRIVGFLMPNSPAHVPCATDLCSLFFLFYFFFFLGRNSVVSLGVIALCLPFDVMFLGQLRVV